MNVSKSSHKMISAGILVVVVSFGLHFGAGSFAMQFLSDQARDASVIWNAWTEHRPILTGPTTSLGNVHTGPLFYYLYAPVLVAFQFEPVAGLVWGYGLFLLSCVVLWTVSREWLSRAASLVVVTLFATSETILLYSLFPWNPNALPLFFLLWCLTMIVVIRNRSASLFESLTLAFLLAVLTHLHLSTAILILVTLLSFILFRIRGIRPLHLLLSVFVFVLSYVPLLVDNLQHANRDLTALQTYQSGQTFNVFSVLEGTWNVLEHIVRMMIFTPFSERTGVSVLLTSFFLLGIVVLAFARHNSAIHRFLLLTLITTAFGLGMISPLQWHYLLPLAVFPLWIIGALVDSMLHRDNRLLLFGMVLPISLIIGIQLGSSIGHLVAVRNGFTVSGYGSEYPNDREAVRAIVAHAEHFVGPIRIDVHRSSDNDVFRYLLRLEAPHLSSDAEEPIVRYLIRRPEDGSPEPPYQLLFENTRTRVFWAEEPLFNEAS
ncbi:MAG: hypothetical protein HYZ08_02465 [Candidatus Kerfeldbacteria bacterium]|nr:hypothetical protein [Candidatus Kerfeldbacteria bacterium]